MTKFGERIPIIVTFRNAKSKSFKNFEIKSIESPKIFCTRGSSSVSGIGWGKQFIKVCWIYGFVNSKREKEFSVWLLSFSLRVHQLFFSINWFSSLSDILTFFNDFLKIVDQFTDIVLSSHVDGANVKHDCGGWCDPVAIGEWFKRIRFKYKINPR